MKYSAPWWLPGGNLQTIWAARLSRRFISLKPAFRRERWETPDKDFVDVDWLASQAGAHGSMNSKPAPLLVVFHGLEGSSESHYAEALADAARVRGWACAVPHFRGCSGELNLAPRAYHSGDFEEIDWILKRLKSQHTGPVFGASSMLGAVKQLRSQSPSTALIAR